MIECIHYGLYLPSIYWIERIKDTHTIGMALLAIPCAALCYQVLFCITILAIKRLTKPIKPGQYPKYSFVCLGQWLITKLLEMPEILVMADSLYYPFFLRLLGAKLGSNVEVSEISNITPELIIIHDQGFVAAYASIAAAKTYHDKVFMSLIHI